MASNTISCSICAEFYKDSNDICSTVCGHVFHLSCLQKWQNQTNRCPMCNQGNPQPHRIYLDLETITDVRPSSDTGECKLIIKGIGASQLEKPLSGVVLWLAKIMNVSLSENDIEHVHILRKALHVQFKSERKKAMFMENKYKLKRNPQTEAIVVHEILDRVTRELFEYSHKLKERGYQTIFVKNKNIFVKMERNSAPIKIVSKGQVDALCIEAEKHPSRPIQQHKETIAVHTTANRLAYGTSRNPERPPIYRRSNVSQEELYNMSDIEDDYPTYNSNTYRQEKECNIL